jgi:hypothetical protein
MSCGPRHRTHYPQDLYGGVVQVAGRAGPAASRSSLGHLQRMTVCHILAQRLPLVLTLPPGAAIRRRGGQAQPSP